MKVFCPTCNDYTLLNGRNACSWCEQKIPEKWIIKAKKDQR